VDIEFQLIHVPEHNKLIIVTPDGSEVERRWQHKSRRDSWTDEMKHQARLHQQKGMERRKSNASGSKND
jgi:hypothetical protein